MAAGVCGGGSPNCFLSTDNQPIRLHRHRGRAYGWKERRTRMRKLLSILMLASLAALPLVAGGCLATPAYSPIERYQQIGRNWDMEGKQAVDDWDHIALLRPNGRMSIWNVR
jgi:hypothetical protein